MNLANRPHAGLTFPRAGKRRNFLSGAVCALAALAGQALAAPGEVSQATAAPNTVAVPARQVDATGDSRAFAETASGIFGTVDLVTGAFTEIYNSATVVTGGTFAGFGVVDATLYGVDYNQANGTLYRINTTTGVPTAIGSSTVTYELFGSTSSGVLYAVGRDGNLYTVQATTGAATLIAPLSVALSGGSWYSLSTGAPLLYLDDGQNLYKINTGTGAATLVGATGGPQMGAMAYENGVLWGGQNSPSLAVAKVNTSTGSATTGPAVTGASSGNWYAMAPDPIPLVSTATSLVPSKSTAPDGTTITLTAMVTSTQGTTTPTGAVEFFNATSELGKVTANGTGQAVFKAADLPLGANSLTAKYLGDAKHAVSTSPVAMVTITADATHTVLAASPTSGPPGATITLTATVTLKSGTIAPTGTVTFKEGTKVLGTATVGTNGAAVLKISTLKAGTNSMTADYAGDASDKTSKSSAVTVTIS